MDEANPCLSDEAIKAEFERQVRQLRGDWSWLGPSYLRADDGRVIVLNLDDFRRLTPQQLPSAIARQIDRQVKSNCCSF